MIAIPANLPLTCDARIPQTYAAAKKAMAKCWKVDECKDWADKAEALASYARQADDDELRKMADRIQARAIQRCGQLLRQMAPKETRPAAKPAANGKGTLTISRKKAAKDAGMSTHQKRTALRVANVSEEEFEAAVESENPPTVTQLAERGKKPAPTVVTLVDLKGRDPKEFALSTQAQGWLNEFAQVIAKIPAAVAVRGAFGHERKKMLVNADKVITWIEQMKKEVANASSDS